MPHAACQGGFGPRRDSLLRALIPVIPATSHPGRHTLNQTLCTHTKTGPGRITAQSNRQKERPLLTRFGVDGLKTRRPGPESNREEAQEEKEKVCVCVWTYWYEKLLDLLQGVTHPGVGLRRRGEHLDEDVQVFVQVVIFGLATLP